jgi:hypothetical protein
MILLKIFAALSVILSLASGPLYFLDIIKRRTKPQRATWLIISVISIVAFVAQFQLGAKLSLLFTGLDALGSTATFILSLWYGSGKWSTHDKIALAIATAGIVISVIARAPLLALCGAILADISGATLTIIKTYQHPETENTLSWLLIGTASVFGALAVGKLNASLLLFPIYLAVIEYAIPFTQLLATKNKLKF